MKPISELIIDAYGCAGDLNDKALLEKTARKGLKRVGARLVTTATHKFRPHGLTLCFILEESHLVISTWPEYQLAIMNIFLCNPKMDTKEVWGELEKVLQPSSCTFHEVDHYIAPEKRKKAA